MTLAIISEKGQLTIPSAIRVKAHLSPGSRVEIQWREGEIVLRPLKRLSDLAGIFQHAAMGKSFEEERTEMEEAVAREVADEGR